MYNTVVRLCQFFGCGGKLFSNENTFDFLWAVSTKKSYWVTLLWSASRYVYFIRPNTHLLSIFPFCIFLLYHTDPQIEVQIRILLKDKYVSRQLHFDLRKNLIGLLYFTETTRLPRYVSHMIQTFHYCISLSCIVLIYNLTVTIVSQKYWELSVQVETCE